MSRILHILVCLFALSLGSLFGQGMTLAGGGYSDPSIIRVAPGQVTTLFVIGLRTVLSSQPARATNLPLPSALAGISVTLNQAGQQPLPVPLLSLQQMSICSNGGAPPPPPGLTPGPPSGLTPDCLITTITAQIPFELDVANGHTKEQVAELTVSENGNVSKAFRILPITDNLHILNTCDAFPSEGSFGNSCNAVVTHGDGTPVTANSPAKAGETVVIYAFGLGQTSPAVKTGEASPMPAASVFSGVSIQFDFRPNAGPSRPYINPLIMAPVVFGPVFVGLTPQQVGLYQINLRIPDNLPPLQPCGAAAVVAANTVQTNLTLDIGGVTSFDGAAICVQPPQ